jgi:hypothetical protein
LMQPYADAGKTVLGTPLSGHALGGGLGAGLALGAIEHPELLKYALPAAAGMLPLYSRPVQWGLDRLVAARPDLLAAPGAAVSGLAPYIGAAAPPLWGALGR